LADNEGFQEKYQGKVIELIGRTGVRGEATQVRVKVLQALTRTKLSEGT